MAEYEQTFNALAGVEAVMDVIADPARLAGMVTALHLADTDVVEGQVDLDAPDLERPEAAPEARFFVDRPAHRVEWGGPNASYGGSIEVAEKMASLSGVTVRIHIRDDADPAEVRRVFDEAVQNLRNAISGR